MTRLGVTYTLLTGVSDGLDHVIWNEKLVALSIWHWDLDCFNVCPTRYLWGYGYFQLAIERQII